MTERENRGTKKRKNITKERRKRCGGRQREKVNKRGKIERKVKRRRNERERRKRRGGGE